MKEKIVKWHLSLIHVTLLQRGSATICKEWLVQIRDQQNSILLREVYLIIFNLKQLIFNSPKRFERNEQFLYTLKYISTKYALNSFLSKLIFSLCCTRSQTNKQCLSRYQSQYYRINTQRRLRPYFTDDTQSTEQISFSIRNHTT